MRLAKAIRQGASTGHPLAAIARTLGVNLRTAPLGALTERCPDSWHRLQCPVCQNETQIALLLAWHLADTHHWSCAQIAGWLDYGQGLHPLGST